MRAETALGIALLAIVVGGLAVTYICANYNIVEVTKYYQVTGKHRTYDSDASTNYYYYVEVKGHSAIAIDGRTNYIERDIYNGLPSNFNGVTMYWAATDIYIQQTHR